MTVYNPNVFVQTKISLDSDKVIIEKKWKLIDIRIEIYSGMYAKYVRYKWGHEILYIRILKALHAIRVSSILYYKKFRKDTEGIKFEVNTYDICVADPMKSCKQQTLTWHVDDLKSSHVDPIFNDEFAEWCK